jgi:hypothetical protein
MPIIFLMIIRDLTILDVKDKKKKVGFKEELEEHQQTKGKLQF